MDAPPIDHHHTVIIRPPDKEITARVWCNLALFFMSHSAIWRVQLPRGKPKQVCSLTTKPATFHANDKFVLVSVQYDRHLLLFARDGTLPHEPGDASVLFEERRVQLFHARRRRDRAAVRRLVEAR
jgi:hypothetical protein